MIPKSVPRVNKYKNKKKFLTNSDIYFVTRWNSIKKKRKETFYKVEETKEEKRYNISKCINS
jgi:hypothetical protein